MPTGKRGQVTSLAPWFGGKRTLAGRIVEALGEHRAYWEPFCGSMAVLLSKPVATSETVNDLHCALVNLAWVIRDESLSAKLHWRLRRTLAAEQLFRESREAVRNWCWETHEKEPNVDWAYHYFVASWLGMNGFGGTANVTNYARRFSSRGGDPAGRFVAAVDSLPEWHERLRSVSIYSTNGVELCERIEDRAGTVIYADPPYLVKGAQYLHDFKSEDHERLAAALRRFKETRVVVSYYEHPELARLYPGWRKLDVATAKGLVNTGERTEGRTEAPEVLLINQQDQT